MHGRTNQNGAANLARLFKIKEAAEALHISTRSVWRLIATGDLKTVRLGRSVRVPVSEIDRLIEKGGVQ